MWKRLGQQWSKHAPTLAAVFAPLAVVGGVVAVVQGRMLTDQGWTVPLGDVVEWVAGLGSVAAFGALYVAISQWRSGQVERRDQEAGQARLMIAELVTDRAFYEEWGLPTICCVPWCAITAMRRCSTRLGAPGQWPASSASHCWVTVG